MCPEPGCDFASKERQDIARHMKNDHISEKKTNACLKLFFCPTCLQNLELKSKEVFQLHLQLCGQRQMSPQLSTKDDELTNDPSPMQVPDITPSNDNVSSLPNADDITTNDSTEDFEVIKCHLCEFDLLDTGPLQPTNNGRRRMMQHYSDIHKIRNMRLCEKRGCDFRSTIFKLRRQHRIEHEGHAQCEICGNKLRAGRLEKHIQDIHGDKTFDCDYCGRPYGNRQAFRKHLFKHHGKEAYAKFVEKTHSKRKKRVPGICQVCGEYVEDQRVHVIAWHPDVSAPGGWKSDLTKGIRKLTKKPRWAERVNKRQKELSEQGILPPNPNNNKSPETIRHNWTW